MIGAILSLHYVGKKGWLSSLIFWFGYIIAGAVISGLLFVAIPSASYGSLLLSVAVFMALAHYWYKYKWEMAFKLLVVAFIIDLVIAVVVIGLIIAALGLTLPEFWETLYPPASLL